MAPVLSFLLCLLTTPAIAKVAGGFNSPIKEELLDTQAHKKGTCALGSLAISLSVLAGVLVSGDKQSLFLFLNAVPFLLIGLADDIAKYLRHYSDGLSSLSKLILQLAASAIVAYAICDRAQGSLEWYIYYPVAVLFISATVNALNITDGLDSLATKVSMPALLMAAVCFPALRSANLVLFTALAAWLIFNSPKASIFMGDGGSHFIGAFLALDGLVSGSVPSLLIALLPAYIELLSSFVQIVSIRLFGRKVFLIAPLHHDLEKRGLGEAKITDIFLSLSVFSSLLSAMLFSEVL